MSEPGGLSMEGFGARLRLLSIVNPVLGNPHRLVFKSWLFHVKLCDISKSLNLPACFFLICKRVIVFSS